MTAKEMFKELGYETSSLFKKDHIIEYIKFVYDDFYGRKIDKDIIFNKRTKRIKILGIIDTDDLKTINKQVEELGWYDGMEI